MELQKWRELLMPYELAVDELKVKFEHVIRENREMGRYSCIERVDGRVKSLSSILDKAKRKGIPIDRVTEELCDIAGIRLICQFVEDIEKVADFIRHRSDMEVVEEVDYINHPKESGYRSYHITVNYEVITIYGKKKILVEIQIRTLAMNFWSIIEHSLQYKYSEHLPDYIRDRLKASARAVVELDQEMSLIREDIMMAQDFFFGKARVVSEIKNNIQNLYKYENRDAILNIQNEFFELYKNGTLDELQEFSRALDKIAENRGVQNL